MEVEQSDITGFSAFLLTRNRKQTTVYRHLNTLRLLPGVDSLSLNKFLVDQKTRGKRHSYLNHFIDTSRIWCEYKNLEKPVVRRFCDQAFSKATMSDTEIEAFLSLSPPKGCCRRLWDVWTMFFKIMAYTGMRPTEVAHLTIDDVDFGRGVFILTETKTDQPRIVPISPILIKDVTSHLTGLKGAYLFPSDRGGNHNFTGKVFDNVDWWYNFHKRIKLLGIKRTNLTPYSLRHSLITRLLEEDVNLFKVQKIVGHRRVETTAQYTHLTTKDITEALNKDPLSRRGIDPRSILVTLITKVTELFEKDTRFEKTVEDKGDEVVIRIKIKNC